MKINEWTAGTTKIELFDYTKSTIFQGSKKWVVTNTETIKATEYAQKHKDDFFVQYCPEYYTKNAKNCEDSKNTYFETQKKAMNYIETILQT